MWIAVGNLILHTSPAPGRTRNAAHRNGIVSVLAPLSVLEGTERVCAQVALNSRPNSFQYGTSSRGFSRLKDDALQHPTTLLLDIGLS